MKIDLHGFHPSQVTGSVLAEIIKQAWEAGADHLVVVHGHGRGRGITPGFVRTNTGFFGLEIRRELRENKSLRKWIKYTTLECGHDGSTTIKLKRNPSPNRDSFSDDLLPEPMFQTAPPWARAPSHPTRSW